ncbi:MAG: PepSY domain-containing protein [Alphaproteobacteria bacterium]|nr:PepSY domain-containing protein [Alphaproteobacteria bacterium]
MKLGLSPSLVRNSLAAHAWLGLLVGFPMFLVCLSGTLAVFGDELGRWEQPQVAEAAVYTPAEVERAYREVLVRQTDPGEHMFIRLPTVELPRLSVASGKGGWFAGPDGTLGPAIGHAWTDMLIDLHLYLHLPARAGMTLVSALGALLCGLIVSGFLAHPRLFRDAFSLRMRGGRRIGQTDLHNRLSVWGAPFHLAIAVTGAYFGLAGFMLMLFASASYDGDMQAVRADLFGPDPVLEQSAAPAAVGRALAQMHRIAPSARPFYLTVEDVGRPDQYMIVGAQHPGRLIYAEQYRFDASGAYLGKAGYSDGPVGRQAVFSVYRLHFGQFGGFAVKLLYGVFGLALTVVAVTGINIWLAKRRARDALDRIWAGLVWGTPAALAVSAVAQVVLGLPSTGLFWAIVVSAGTAAARLGDEARAKAWLQAATAAGLGALLAGYVVRYGADALDPAALGVNLAVAACGLAMAVLARRQWKALAAQQAPTAG